MEKTLHIARISPTTLDVAKELPLAVILQCGKNVFGFAGQRVGEATQQHVANFGIRNNVMQGFNCQATGHQLMVDRLVYLCLAATVLQTDTG
ncbi:hypothetical protein D3C73_1276750 [compost metagenome]